MTERPLPAPGETFPTIAAIQAAVAAEFVIELRHMRSRRRARYVSRPRQVAMFLAARCTPQSMLAIGRAFDRDHTTVMYAERHIADLIAQDAALAGRVEHIRQALVGAAEGERT